MMSTLTDPPLKRSAALRFLRSYSRRIAIGLILILATSSLLWWPTFVEYRKENRIAEKIWNAGGGVGRDGIFVYRRITSVHLSKCRTPNGLPEDINELRHLESLDLENSLVTDADLEHLRGLDQLKNLILEKTQISNSGLENLRGLTNLRGLNLSDTQISDAGLEHLKGLNIIRLDLQGTAVTEAGLEHLKELPNLTDLNFVDTPISDVGLEHLKGMPNLKKIIFYGNPGERKKHVTPNVRAKLEEVLPNCSIIQ